MPYKRFGKCVFKTTKSGKKKDKKGCSDSIPMAKKYLKALYANTSDVSEQVDEYLSEILLNEARFKDVKAKYSQYMTLVDSARDYIRGKLGDKGVSKYILYVMKETHRMVDEPQTKYEVIRIGTQDIASVIFNLIDMVEKFDKNISRIEQKDIYQLNASELENLVDKLPSAESEKRRQRKEKAENESVRIYDDNDIIAVRPLTEAASIYYGMGTKWCISATECRNYFDSYTAQGKAFVMIILKNLQKEGGYRGHEFSKVAMVFNSMGEYEELYDASDEKYYSTSDLRDAIALNHTRTGQNHFNDLDDEEQEEIEDILKEITDEGSAEIAQNPPDASAIYHQKLEALERRYENAIKHGSYSYELVHDDFDGGMYVRGSASLYVEIPASELLKEPSYKEQMQLGDDIRDALDNELQIYTPNLDANMTSMHHAGRYQRVFNVDIQFYDDGDDATVDGYEELLGILLHADRQYSNIVNLVRKILKDGGFMADQEQTQQDKEAAEKLQKIDDADGTNPVDVNEDVNLYLENLLLEARVKDVKAAFPILAKSGWIEWARNSISERIGPKAVSKYLKWWATSIDNDFEIEKHPDQDPNNVENLVDNPDITEVGNVLITLISRFDKNIDRMKEKDIYKYRAIDLQMALDDIGLSRAEKNKIAKEESVVVYDENDIFAVIPKTEKSSCYYGRNTRWCISARENNAFASYMEDGDRFVMIRMNNLPEDDSVKKVALVFDDMGGFSNEIYNAPDSTIAGWQVVEAIKRNITGDRPTIDSWGYSKYYDDDEEMDEKASAIFAQILRIASDKLMDMVDTGGFEYPTFYEGRAWAGLTQVNESVSIEVSDYFSQISKTELEKNIEKTTIKEWLDPECPAPWDKDYQEK